MNNDVSVRLQIADMYVVFDLLWLMVSVLGIFDDTEFGCVYTYCYMHWLVVCILYLTY